MSGAHWTAIGFACGAIFLQVQSAPNWSALLTTSAIGSIGLQLSSLCIALGAKSVWAPQPTSLDAVKAFAK